MSAPDPKHNNDHAQTTVEDMLIKSIEPQIQEIQDKIGKQEPLSKDDIYTLLLKSQYNHINHLDQKLNHMSNEVSDLKVKFGFLEQRVDHKIDTLEQKVDRKIDTLEQKVDHKINVLEQKVDHKIDALEQKIDSKFATFEQKMQTTIQKALNRNMIALTFVMGFFLTLSKLIDKF